MATVSSWLALCFIYLALCPSVVMLDRIPVDMTGPGCFQQDYQLTRDDQVYTVHANYLPHHEATLDRCDVTIRATESNRRLDYLIEKLTIFDCGTTLLIFDNPTILNNPTKKLTCDDSKTTPIQARTSHGVVKFSLVKESTQNKAFEFQIQVKTDQGPPFDFERDSTEFYELPLDTGAIVGIVIAGAVLMIVITGLAIYCCLKRRTINKRHHQASEAPSPPRVVTSGKSGVLYQPASSKQQMVRAGEGRHGSSVDRGQISSKDKASLYSNGVYSHKESAFHDNKDVNVHKKGSVIRTDQGGSVSHKDKYNSVRSHQDHHQYTNQAYEEGGDEKRFERQASYRRSQKGGRHDTPSDDADYSHVRSGGHVSRRDSSRGGKYNSRGSVHKDRDVTRAHKQPMNGSVKNRGKSLNHSRSSTEWSTMDTASDYSYADRHSRQPHHTKQSTQQPRSRSGSTRSRSRTKGLGSQRSASANRSRAGSVGRSGGRDLYQEAYRSKERTYGHVSGMPDRSSAQELRRPRARSTSAGRSRRQ